jgi:c-di-GMP-binding flagellar brake protein YcgR
MALNKAKKEVFWDYLNNKIEVLKIKVVGKDEVSFNSKVGYVTDEYIEITMNRVKGTIPPVYKKDKLDVVGTLNNGQQVLFYVTVRQIKLSEDPKKPSIIVVEWPDNFVKKQMRQDVRVDATLKIYYSDQINEQNYLDTDKQYVGYLVDISRGGGFFITNEKVIFKGKPFHLFLYFNDGEHQLSTIIPCEVVVVKKIGSSKEAKWQGMAFSFTNLSKKTEEMIVNWIFMCQRRQLASRKTK